MDDLESDRCTCKSCKPDPLWRPSDAFRERAPVPITTTGRVQCRGTAFYGFKVCPACHQRFPAGAIQNSVRTATVAWREVPVDGVLIIQAIPLDGVGEASP